MDACHQGSVLKRSPERVTAQRVSIPGWGLELHIPKLRRGALPEPAGATAPASELCWRSFSRPRGRCIHKAGG